MDLWYKIYIYTVTPDNWVLTPQGNVILTRFICPHSRADARSRSNACGSIYIKCIDSIFIQSICRVVPAKCFIVYDCLEVFSLRDVVSDRIERDDAILYAWLTPCQRNSGGIQHYHIEVLWGVSRSCVKKGNIIKCIFQFMYTLYQYLFVQMLCN